MALVLSMGGVSYGLATGSVDSREIKNNTVRTQDLRNGHVRQNDIQNNAVRSRHINNGAVNSGDIANNSVTGADVNESTLGQVPSANTANDASTLQGLSANQLTVGRSGFDSGCDPQTAAFEDCATASIPLPRLSRLLVVAEAPFGSDAANSQGNCRIEVDGVAVPNTTARTGLAPASSGGDELNVGYGITTVTAPVAAGNHTVSVACNQDAGDIDHNDTTISVVSLGAG